MKKINFSFVSNNSTVVNKNEEATSKLSDAMLNGARLVLKPYTNKEGYPYFWVEAIFSNRTDQFSIPAYDEILQMIINYTFIEKVQEISYNEESYNKSKTEQDFALELFKTLVESKVRINTVSAFKGARSFNAMTNHRKGQIVFKIERTEEFEDYLAENNLI